MSQDGKDIDINEMIAILVACKNELGSNISGKMYVPIPRKNGDRGVRVEFYKQLIHNLQSYGYGKTAIKSTQFLDRLVEASHNPNSDASKVWKQLVIDDWNDACHKDYGLKITTYDSSNDPKPPEKERYEKPEPDESYEDSTELQNPLDRSTLGDDIPTPKYVEDQEFINSLLEGGDTDE